MIIVIIISSSSSSTRGGAHAAPEGGHGAAQGVLGVSLICVWLFIIR